MQKNIDLIEELSDLLFSKNKDRERKITLILHVGTPKTGTTSLQTYLDKKQGKLRRKGILYPHNLDKVQNPTAPRHQWFERNLVTQRSDFFLENLRNVIAQVKSDTHTIILSSEGIYNYWWDFSDQSMLLLKQLSALFDTHIWLWFREPLSFIERYYKQCIRNPQIDGNPCYGKDLSLEEMLQINWFSQHLNYQGFVSDCERLFGSNNVHAFDYQGDVVQEVLRRLNIATPHDNPTPRKNESLDRIAISLLRQLNQLDITAKDKEKIMPYIKGLNQELSAYDSEPFIGDSIKAAVSKLIAGFQVDS